MNTQFKFSFMLLLLILSAFPSILGINNLAYAEQNSKVIKSSEDYFADSYNCLKKNDKACAQIAAANIQSLSPYSRLISGIFASLEGDFETTFLELLPLQTNKSFNLQASVSLHTSLALAYENQSDSLRALEQRVIADELLHRIAPPNLEDTQANEQQIWEIVSVLSKKNLTEMRGNSTDTNIQGWIDLALAAKYQGDGQENQQAINRWHLAYPDHSAKNSIAAKLFPASPTKKSLQKAKLKGPVAILLPFSNAPLYPISDAIERGFAAAKKIANDNAAVKIYSSETDAASTIPLYQQALNEGANYVLGPLNKEATDAVSREASKITTLMLHKAENTPRHPKQFFYGLSATDEIQQIIKLALNSGMTKAAILKTNQENSPKYFEEFKAIWLAEGGLLTVINTFDQDIKKQINDCACDMIFMAESAENARLIRRLLPTNIPTFALSEIFSGPQRSSDDAPLKGIQFVDAPWLTDRENPKFDLYREAAKDLPAGEMQRWFALGADAYEMLITLDKIPASGATINGLSGKIEISASGEIKRTLSNASFNDDGIRLEAMP
jgi:hypothetical protein